MVPSAEHARPAAPRPAASLRALVLVAGAAAMVAAGALLAARFGSAVTFGKALLSGVVWCG